MSPPLAGRVAIVTGANHGIGAAVALALAGLGADVCAACLPLEVSGQEGVPARYAEDRRRDAAATVAAVEAAGTRAVSVAADLSDPGAPAAIFDAAESALGPVAILVNNASGWCQDTFSGATSDGLGRGTREVTAASADAQLLVDARGSALMIAELAARLRVRGGGWGRIVGLTSGGRDGFPGEVSYGAAKAAMESYTLSAAAELAAEGVTANVVHPPVTDTGWVTDAVREAVRADPELHHVAEPADVAEVVAWLCTDAARLVTGTVVRMR